MPGLGALGRFFPLLRWEGGAQKGERLPVSVERLQSSFLKSSAERFCQEL